VNASDLMTTLARIQNATGTERTALIAKAKGDLSKAQWSSPAMREWSIWAFNEGIKQ
jgi:hypothetical protein